MATSVVKEDGFEIVNFGDISPAMCPCGQSWRAFVDGDGSMSLHKVEIQSEDKPHKHETDEIYFIILCGDDAAMILDGKRYPIEQGQAVKIKGGKIVEGSVRVR